MYPYQPLLLPAYYDNPKTQFPFANYQKIVDESKWVSKPLFGREGIGVFLSSNFSSFDEFVKTTENNYGYNKTEKSNKYGKSIYQLYHKLPVAQGRVIQTSTWVIGGQPAGIVFREGKAGTNFEDRNPVIPNIVLGKYAMPFWLKQTVN